MMIHTGKKPFACGVPECEFAARTASDLSAHSRTHSGEKPSYFCNEPDCKYACNTSSDLNKHTRIHTNTKPYACDVLDCGYAGRNSSNLIAHKRTHMALKSYVCEHCSHALANKKSLRRHLEMHERQLNFKFKCGMQDGGVQRWQTGDVECAIRCETQTH